MERDEDNLLEDGNGIVVGESSKPIQSNDNSEPQLHGGGGGGEEASCLSTTLFLDHVGQVILTFNSDGLSWEKLHHSSFNLVNLSSFFSFFFCLDKIYQIHIIIMFVCVYIWFMSYLIQYQFVILFVCSFVLFRLKEKPFFFYGDCLVFKEWMLFKCLMGAGLPDVNWDL